MTVAAVGITTLQFSGADGTASNLRRLVQDLVNVEKALNNLISLENAATQPSDTVPPHVLATTGGLDSDHTVSGLTAGQVLKAISATNAAFSKLKFSEISGSDVTDSPENGDFMQFVDGFWVASPAPPGGSTGLNIGAGSGIYASNSGAVLQFKSLLNMGGLILASGVNNVGLGIDPIPATALLDLFTATLQGLVPPPGTPNGAYLRDDGTWQLIIPGSLGGPYGAQWVQVPAGAVLALPTNPVVNVAAANATIKEVRIYTQGGAGSCVINVWKAAAGSFPAGGNDITGGVPPAIIAGTAYDNTVLTGWNTAVLAGDVFLFTLASVSGLFTGVWISVQVG